MRACVRVPEREKDFGEVPVVIRLGEIVGPLFL